MPIYYEDLERGDTFETGEYTVTKEEIVEFAQQFDPQPFHVDEEAAKDSIFGGLAASGIHTLCIAVRLFVTEFTQGENRIANLGGLGMDELRWHEAVRPGDTLSVTHEVVEMRPSESDMGRGYVDFRRTVSKGDGVTAMTFLTHNIIKRDPDRTNAH